MNTQILDIKTDSYMNEDILKHIREQEKKFGKYPHVLYTTRLESQRVTNLEKNVVKNFKK